MSALTPLQKDILRRLKFARLTYPQLADELTAHGIALERDRVLAELRSLRALAYVGLHEFRGWWTTALGCAALDEVLLPNADEAMRTPSELLARETPCAPRRNLGTGDTRPVVYRRGALDALQLPSRQGDTLVYRREWQE